MVISLPYDELVAIVAVRDLPSEPALSLVGRLWEEEGDKKTITSLICYNAPFLYCKAHAFRDIS